MNYCIVALLHNSVSQLKINSHEKKKSISPRPATSIEQGPRPVQKEAPAKSSYSRTSRMDRNAYSVLLKNMEDRRRFEDLNVDRRILK
jgi:hypothetical protein